MYEKLISLFAFVRGTDASRQTLSPYASTCGRIMFMKYTYFNRKKMSAFGRFCLNYYL